MELVTRGENTKDERWTCTPKNWSLQHRSDGDFQCAWILQYPNSKQSYLRCGWLPWCVRRKSSLLGRVGCTLLLVGSLVLRIVCIICSIDGVCVGTTAFTWPSSWTGSWWRPWKITTPNCPMEAATRKPTRCTSTDARSSSRLKYLGVRNWKECFNVERCQWELLSSRDVEALWVPDRGYRAGHLFGFDVRWRNTWKMLHACGSNDWTYGTGKEGLLTRKLQPPKNVSYYRQGLVFFLL